MNMIVTPGHPHFNVHKRNYHEIEQDIHYVVQGRYCLQRIKPDVGVIAQLEFPNLITNIGMDSIGANVFTLSAVHVGTGTATPAITDTSLQTFGVGFNSSATQSGANAGSPDYYVRRTYSWTSTIGGATGNWTEIGVSNQVATGNLRSRALILDGGGSPTSFTVLADEQLKVFYLFDVYPLLTDDTRTVSISGVDYNTVTRGFGIQGYHAGSFSATPSSVAVGQLYSGNLVANVSATPSGPLGNASVAGGTYTSGNYFREFSLTYPPGTATGTGRTLTVSNYYSTNSDVQIQYDKTSGGGGIVKSATQQLILNVRRSWARR